MLKTNLVDGNLISNSSSKKIDNKEISNDSIGNSENKKFREILTMSKSRNLITSKKITKNSIIRFELRFLSLIAKEVFN